jgi:serine/threonine protein kinase, bacterial
MSVFKIAKVLPLVVICSVAGLSGCNNTNSTSYSLSGAITVSAGGNITGLVLSDGIASTVSPAAGDTTFAFNSHTPYLFTNTHYTVTVQKQPANLRCNVTNGSGMPSGADVSNVSIACLKPSAPMVLTPLGNNASVTGLVTDQNNNTYVANNGVLLKIAPNGTSTNISLVDANGASLTTLPVFSSLAINATGTLLYASTTNNVYTITLPAVGGASTYKMTLLAGSGVAGVTNAQGANASFSMIQGLAVDVNGNVYVRDAGTSLSIRRIDTNGNVVTLAGSGQKGHIDSPGVAASFDFTAGGNAITSGLSIDANGYLYVVEGGSNNDVRIVNSAGVVNTLVGSSTTAGHADGAGTAATFSAPYAIDVDANANIYVVDGDNSLRLITTAGNVTTLLAPGPTPFTSVSHLTLTGDLYLAARNLAGEVQKLSFN